MTSCLHFDCRLGTRGRYEVPLFSDEAYLGGPAMTSLGCSSLHQDGLKGFNQGQMPRSVIRCFSTSQLVFLFTMSAEITVSISAIDPCETAAAAQSSQLHLPYLTSAVHCNGQTDSTGV